MKQNIVLVDSSIWIECFKSGHSIHRIHLDRLLVEDQVAICGPVKAEVLSGVRSLEDFRKLSSMLEALPYLSVSDDKLWNRVAESRFKLARHGVQQKLIDLVIAWIAHDNNVPVWTSDKDFVGIKDEVPFKIYHP